jgi:hypothetical protein
MTPGRDQARDQALTVPQDIWHAREGEPPDVSGHGKACKAMRHVGFAPVDDDLRTAWRTMLEREGKLGARTVADLLAERRTR